MSLSDWAGHGQMTHMRQIHAKTVQTILRMVEAESAIARCHTYMVQDVSHVLLHHGQIQLIKLGV